MEIIIKLASLDCLETLEKYFPTEDSRHTYHFQRQCSGASVYLIAWLNGIPVGRGALIWLKKCKETISQNSGMEAYMEDLFVREEFRSKGIGKKIIEEMERRSLEKGLHVIGLGVNIDNLRARKFYYNLNYQEATNLCPCTLLEKKVNSYGNEIETEETYLYLVKKI